MGGVREVARHLWLRDGTHIVSFPAWVPDTLASHRGLQETLRSQPGGRMESEALWSEAEMRILPEGGAGRLGCASSPSPADLHNDKSGHGLQGPF